MLQPRRKILIAGNWKMHLTLAESVRLARAIRDNCGQNDHNVEVLLCPPFTALTVVEEVLKGSGVRLGAQNMHGEPQGAYTGEVSPRQLQDLGCTHVLLGHSERRQHFGETDEALRRKTQAALFHNLVPVLCVGESLEEREEQQTFTVLKRQLAILEGMAPTPLSNLVVAYEPVWAIGTGRTATPAQAQEAQLFIRSQLVRLFSEGFAQSIRILYGGSVKPDNIDATMAQPDVDGALVGGASIEPESFLRIVHFKGGPSEG